MAKTKDDVKAAGPSVAAEAEKKTKKKAASDGDPKRAREGEHIGPVFRRHETDVEITGIVGDPARIVSHHNLGPHR